MTPRITGLRLSAESGRDDLPLLVLGPSLGTSAATVWSGCAARLTAHFDVLAWDLPGHGSNATVGEAFSMAELARGVLHLVEEVLAEREQDGTGFAYAGVSVGGCVGLQLMLDVPDRVTSSVLLCTGARIGEPVAWHDRIALVGGSGTPAMVAASATRWFAPGFLDREPELGSALLHALSDADDTGYQQVCAALADFDVRGRLGEITTPVLAVAGADDQVTPPAGLAAIADGVADGRLVVLDGVAHLAPAEAPAEVAALIGQHIRGVPARSRRHDAGMRVRREVLGDAHVDRAVAATTDLTRDFQELITEYAWGSIWTRPGLDRRSRSLITLTALVARGHHEELAMHLRAARTNGLTVEEIKECLMQTAIYCGVPDANSAFRVAQQVFEDES